MMMIIIIVIIILIILIIDSDSDDSDDDDWVSNGTPKQGHRSALRPRLLRSERRRPAHGSVDKRPAESQIVMSF